MNRIQVGDLTLVWIIVIHVVWGVMLLLSPDPLQATPLAGISALLPGVSEGWLMLVVAGLAILSVYRVDWSRKWRIALMIPQQILLGASLVSPSMAVYNGYYADLEPRSRMFIFADQLPSMSMFVFHAIAMCIKFNPKGEK